MLEALVLYVLIGLATAAFTLEVDLLSCRVNPMDVDIVDLVLLYLLRAVTWPYGLFTYRKKR